MLKSFKNKFRPTPSIIIPVAILFVLAFTYRDVLRSMLLVPLAYLIFVFRLIAGGIGQQTLWISFVVFSAILAIFNLAMRREVTLRDKPVELKYPTRLQVWIDTVTRKEHSQYFKWNLAQDLSNLFIEAIAYHQGISQEQVQQQIQVGNIDLPPEILKYLQISQKPYTASGLANQSNQNWLFRKWRDAISPKFTNLNNSPLDIDPEKIIPYLEEYLSVDPKIWES